MQIQACIFDWDGFLFDSEEACRHAHNRVLRACGLPGLSASKYRSRPSNSMSWYRASGVTLSDESVYRLFFAHFDTSDCDLVSGATEVLVELQKRSIRLAIVSAHPTVEIKRRLQSFGIHEIFREVVGDARNGKTKAILETCSKLGTHPRKVLFGDDMPEGVADGKRAGTRAVLYAPANYPHPHIADHHVSDLRQILQLLG